MSEPIVRIRHLARIDLIGCYAYIGERNLDAAHRFRLAAEGTLAPLAKMPRVGLPYETANPRLTGLRCSRIKRFRNYLVFYIPFDDGIEVVRVLHAARDVQAVLSDDAE